MVVVFLVDRTTWYAHVESDLPDLARKHIVSAIRSSVFKPGDTVYGAWMTPQSPTLGEDFVPLRTATLIPAPAPEALPPTPTPKVGQAACRTYCDVDVKNYADEIANYKQSEHDTRLNWEAQQGEAYQQFVAATSSEATSVGIKLDAGYPNIRGALYGASRVFDAYRNEGARLKLVVFSGLIDQPSNNLQFRLEGVNVLVAAYHRHGALYQQQGIAEWTTFFKSAGAQVSAFLPDNATSDADIEDFLAKGRTN
jgi:hypothetical protein